MVVTVLRLGHRAERDKRVTTHVCLAARALGADGVVLCGEKDEKIINGVRKVVDNWGGKFSVAYSGGWKGPVRKAKKNSFTVVHLTMYGERLQDVIGKIKRKRKVLVVVGAEKVPGEVYQSADFNVGVTNQPHSEVAALAVFLHELFGGKELGKRFQKAKLVITPKAKGKFVSRR